MVAESHELREPSGGWCQHRVVPFVPHRRFCGRVTMQMEISGRFDSSLSAFSCEKLQVLAIHITVEQTGLVPII